MLPGARSAIGTLITTLSAPGPTSVFVGGIALSNVGAVHVSTADPQQYVNGYGVRNTGELCIGTMATVVGYSGGYPRCANGALACQVDQPLSPGDAYVGGVRVGPLGGVYISSGVFTPASLFSAGEQGAWFDPSDLSTMFQDSAGTLPVTADGQPVGLILDKSNGLAFGPELATNGDFSNGTTGWVPNTGVSLSNVSNQLVQTSTSIGWLSSFLHVTGVTPGNTYKISIDVVGGSVSSSRYINVGTNGGGYNIFQTPILSNGTLVCYATATLNYFDIGTECFFNNIGDTVILDNVSVKLISGNHASQATAASRPLYKTDGTYHWLQFDGVDDSLITAAINFTSTDKASLFAGVRKVGTSTGVISELSASADTEVGSFVFYGNDTEYGVYSGGTNGTNGKRVFTFTSPITNVVTFEMDRSIAGSGTGVKTYRVNGAVPSFGGVGSTALAAGGNFGTWPIYIGQRGGSAYSFNGNIYSLIVRGALSTTQEITDTETWVNGKTGAY